MDYLKEISGELKGGLSKLKDKFTKTELQRQLKEATSNEHCHANVALLNEISYKANNYNDFQVIMDHIGKKLNCRKEKWRKILKTLFLIEHLLKTGPPSFVDNIRSENYKLKNLNNFTYIDENRADKGETIREKSRVILTLMEDSDKLREERGNYSKWKSRITGVGSTGSSVSSAGGWNSNDRYGPGVSSNNYSPYAYDYDKSDSKKKKEASPSSESSSSEDEDDNKKEKKKKKKSKKKKKEEEKDKDDEEGDDEDKKDKKKKKKKKKKKEKEKDKEKDKEKKDEEPQTKSSNQGTSTNISIKKPGEKVKQPQQSANSNLFDFPINTQTKNNTQSNTNQDPFDVFFPSTNSSVSTSNTNQQVKTNDFDFFPSSGNQNPPQQNISNTNLLNNQFQQPNIANNNLNKNTGNNVDNLLSRLEGLSTGGSSSGQNFYNFSTLNQPNTPAQSFNQPINQLNHPFTQPFNQPNQQFNQQFNQPNQPFNQQFNRPNQPFNQPNQQFNQPFNQSYGQSLNQPFNQPSNQQFDQPKIQFAPNPTKQPQKQAFDDNEFSEVIEDDSKQQPQKKGGLYDLLDTKLVNLDNLNDKKSQKKESPSYYY